MLFTVLDLVLVTVLFISSNLEFIARKQEQNLIWYSKIYILKLYIFQKQKAKTLSQKNAE